MRAGFNGERFAVEVEKLATDVLYDDPPASSARAARRVQALAEEYLLCYVGNDEAIDCRAGCAHCCILNVSVLQPEAISIAEHLTTERSQFQLQNLLEKLSALDLDTRYLDDEERIMVKRKCAFLNDLGSCDIYPFRPLLCRAATSTSAADCKESLAMVALNEETPVMSNLVQREIFETAFMGLARALENRNMDSRSYRLTGAVHTLLNNHLASTF